MLNTLKFFVPGEQINVYIRLRGVAIYDVYDSKKNVKVPLERIMGRLLISRNKGVYIAYTNEDNIPCISPISQEQSKQVADMGGMVSDIPMNIRDFFLMLEL